MTPAHEHGPDPAGPTAADRAADRAAGPTAADRAGDPASGAGDEVRRIGHEHRDVTGGWLRPAVFGAMDGLVSNFALIAGVAGGGVTSRVVILAGLAGLAAGSFSMAAGEYTSVASQTELALGEIEVERLELTRNPRGEQEELAQTYVARGLEPQLAGEVARQLSQDPQRALEIHAREELGVDPHDLPSPRLAAVSSFLSFACGALIPVIPYLFGATSLAPSLVVSALGLFLSGALVTRLTPRSWWYGGTRQLVLGGVAALLTYGFGRLVGSGV